MYKNTFFFCFPYIFVIPFTFVVPSSVIPTLGGIHIDEGYVVIAPAPVAWSYRRVDKNFKVNISLKVVKKPPSFYWYIL